MYLKINELPVMIQTALNDLGYTKKDIKITVTESVSLQGSAGSGQRDHAVLLNLLTGESKALSGSWGGANAFNQNNAVDLDSRDHSIPDNGIVIKATQWHGPLMATVYVSKTNIIPAIKPAQTLSQNELQVLNVIRSYKPAYRKEYLRNIPEDKLTQVYSDLANKGLVKINKIGSVSITTEGKNASK